MTSGSTVDESWNYILNSVVKVAGCWSGQIWQLENFTIDPILGYSTTLAHILRCAESEEVTFLD